MKLDLRHRSPVDLDQPEFPVRALPRHRSRTACVIFRRAARAWPLAVEVPDPRCVSGPLTINGRKWPYCKFRRGHAYAPGSAAASEPTGLLG